MNIQNAIKLGIKELKEKNIRSPFLDSEILMSKAIGKERKYLILNSCEDLDLENYDYFKKLIKKRALGKPIAYLIGKKDFWKYEFDISENILIPRPDSEILVQEFLKLNKNKFKLNVLDIGVGSGCMLLSILKEKPSYYGTGVDINQSCIDICKKNSLKFNLSSRVKFFKSNIDNFNFGKYDLVISNPPYISKLDLKYLEKDIINFEPKTALDGGLDGISEIRKIIKKSSELIKFNGKLFLEIAFDQKDKVKKLLMNNGFYINKVIKDYAKKDRCIVSTKIK